MHTNFAPLFQNTPGPRGFFSVEKQAPPQPGFRWVILPGCGGPVFGEVFQLLKLKFAVKKCKITDFAAFCFAKRTGCKLVVEYRPSALQFGVFKKVAGAGGLTTRLSRRLLDVKFDVF